MTFTKFITLEEYFQMGGKLMAGIVVYNQYEQEIGTITAEKPSIADTVICQTKPFLDTFARYNSNTFVRIDWEPFVK